MPVPLVSVVIPTFDRAGLVCRAVDSALGQTHANMQVVVVDDGSTDGTPAIVGRRYEHEPRVAYVRVENGGAARARNIGISHATGDFVGFLDSDDYWLPWKIELQLKCLERLPEAGMIWTDMTAVGEDGAVVHPRYLRRMYTAYDRIAREGIELFTDSRTVVGSELGIAGLAERFELHHGNVFTPMVIGSVVHTSTCLLRRDRLEKVGGFRESLRNSAEDYDFHLRTCREGAVAFADIATIGYSVGRPDQLTSPSRGVYLAQNAIRVMELVLAESRHLINLPSSTIAHVLSDRHEWAAREHFALGRRGEARRHALKSIFNRPWALHSYTLLVASSLPAAGLKPLGLLSLGGRRERAGVRGGSPSIARGEG